MLQLKPNLYPDKISYENEIDKEIVDNIFDTNPHLSEAFDESFNQERDNISELLAMHKANLFFKTDKENIRSLINKFDIETLLKISRQRLKSLLLRSGRNNAISYDKSVCQEMLRLLRKRYIHSHVLEDDEVIGFAFGQYIRTQFSDKERDVLVKEFASPLE